MVSRRQFLQELGFGVAAGALGLSFSPGSIWAGPVPEFAPPAVRVALLADAHLPDADPHSSAARNLLAAVQEIIALQPPVDLVFSAGDLTDSGDVGALGLGCEILAALNRPFWLLPGERDVAGGLHRKSLGGEGMFSFVHQGVHFCGLDTTTGGATAGGAIFRLGLAQSRWLAAEFSQSPPETPLVFITHAPPYRLFRPWQWWTEDAEVLHKLLQHRQQVWLLHGHVHQNISLNWRNLTFQGLRSTAWPWPDVRVGCQGALPGPMVANHRSGCGWHLLTIDGRGATRIEDHAWLT